MTADYGVNGFAPCDTHLSTLRKSRSSSLWRRLLTDNSSQSRAYGFAGAARVFSCWFKPSCRNAENHRPEPPRTRHFAECRAGAVFAGTRSGDPLSNTAEDWVRCQPIRHHKFGTRDDFCSDSIVKLSYWNGSTSQLI